MFKRSCTYGIFSVNQNTFNVEIYQGRYIPNPTRDLVVTALRLNNLVLHILGYISRLSPISGCIRIGIGAAITIITTAIMNRNAYSGTVVGRWHDEGILIGMAQVFRGVIEAFIPYSLIINGMLDIIGTGVNVMEKIHIDTANAQAFAGDEQAYLYDKPKYPCPFSLLYWV